MLDGDEEEYCENGNTTTSLPTLTKGSAEENTTSVWSDFDVKPQLSVFEDVNKVFVPLDGISIELCCFSVL